ncbi:MAG: hypothetical protein LBJ61_00115 [Deltaproteobacteria bacterium]|jgi:hypothetical protein|nr:hypothetical protein [Deltaproteobacteria bacterium]
MWIIKYLLLLLLLVCSAGQALGQNIGPWPKEGHGLRIYNSNAIWANHGLFLYDFTIDSQSLSTIDINGISNLAIETNYGNMECPTEISGSDVDRYITCRLLSDIAEENLVINRVTGVINGRRYDLTKNIYADDFKPLTIVVGPQTPTGQLSGSGSDKTPSNWLTYDTKGNPKTKGHDFTLRYPPTYILATEFSTDEYLQLFSYEDEESGGDYGEYLSVVIQNTPNNSPASAFQTNGSWDNNKLNGLWNILAKTVPGSVDQTSSVTADGQPISLFLRYGIFTYDDGNYSNTAEVIQFTLRGDKIIKMECGNWTYVSDTDPSVINNNNKNKIIKLNEYLNNNQTCVSYFESLKFTDSN